MGRRLVSAGPTLEGTMDKITDFLRTLQARDYLIAGVSFVIGVLVG